MSTNVNAEYSGIDHLRAELEAAANAYFPEFSARDTSPKEIEYEDYNVQQSFGHDYLTDLPAGFLLDEVIPSNPVADTSAAPFGFLQEARSIFDARPCLSTFGNGSKTTSPSRGVDISEFQIVPLAQSSAGHFDVKAVRRDFPILSEKVNGKDLIWFDNAATTQRPKSVIDRITYFYEHENSNVHRGAHTLAARATDAYEAAREKVAKFLNAPSASDIVFVRGTTEAINLIAHSWGKFNIGKDDEIVISWLEHHANIVPWQILCAQTGAKLRVVPVNEHGEFLLDEYQKLLSSKTKLVSITHVSNALGTVTPIKEIISIAHRYGAKVLIDGAQGISHLKVDVQALDSDFYVFSGHKIFGPTGIGAIYGKKEILAGMQPYQGGGNMIADVTFEKTVYQDAPNRFEAGTGNIADAVGLGAAIDYVNSLGIENINRYEHELLEYGTKALLTIPGVRIIGTAKEKASVLSFVLDGFTTEEVGKALAEEGIAVRFGHHCAQPILRRFGLESTVRPSLAFYNTTEEIDFLVSVVKKLKANKQSGYAGLIG